MKILTFFKKWRECVLLKELQKLSSDTFIFGDDKNALDRWFEKHNREILKSDALLSYLERRCCLAARFIRWVPYDVKTQRLLCRLESDLNGKPCLKYSMLFEVFIKTYELSPEIEKMIFSDEQKYRDAIILLHMHAYRRKA